MKMMTIIVIVNTDNDVYSFMSFIDAKLRSRVRFGSSERKSVSARWPPTRRPGCKRHCGLL